MTQEQIAESTGSRVCLITMLNDFFQESVKCGSCTVLSPSGSSRNVQVHVSPQYCQQQTLNLGRVVPITIEYSVQRVFFLFPGFDFDNRNLAKFQSIPVCLYYLSPPYPRTQKKIHASLNRALK